MRKNLKRNIVILAVLVFVGAAVYLNWSYNSKWGAANSAMATAEDAAMTQAETVYQSGAAEQDAVAAYFAQARLTRQQSRDESLALLESACEQESASQDVIDESMRQINEMAERNLMESVMENELLARSFTDCVVFASDENVTVAVPAPAEGLTESDVAQITETILANSAYTAAALNILEIKE